MMEAVKKQVRRPRSVKYGRFGGILVPRAHEDAAAGDAATGDAVDPNGQVVVDAGTEGETAEARAQAASAAQAGALANVTRANAAASTKNAYAQTLSDYIQGFEVQDYMDLVNFMAPEVRAPFVFRYRVRNLANAFAIVENTGFGINGRPQIVRFDQDSMVTAQLQSHGLMTWLTKDEMDLANSDPQWGTNNEVNERTSELRMADRRGLLARVLSLFATTAGAAEALTWDATTNPITKLRTEIARVALAGGSRSGVRVVFGADAWEIVANHALLRGTGTNYPQMAVTMARIAELCGLPEANFKVSYHEVLSSLQGKTAAKTHAFTAAEVYVYWTSQSPTRNDNSVVKRFVGPYNGQDLWAFQYGISDGSDPFRENMGFCYRELLSATNGSAVDRMTISES
jgi:hypothetical protein